MAVPLETVPVLFWFLVGTSFILAAPASFNALDTVALADSLGGLDPYLALGVTGTLLTFIVFALSRGKLADDNLESAYETSAPQPFSAVLRHGARESSFVVVWVAAAYVAWALLHATTGFDGTQLPLLGVAGVVIGALIGLIPGCAVQIVFTGLYVSGAVPLPTLLANALSQDGDALLPLMALERHSALLATVITVVPGLLVGGLALLLWK